MINHEQGGAQGGLEVQFAAELVQKAKAEGMSLVGLVGLLAGITKTVLEAEMVEHLGYERVNARAPRPVITATAVRPRRCRPRSAPGQFGVPWERAGEFTPQIVPECSRRIEGFDEAIVSRYATGLTTGEIRAHLAEIYQVEVSRDLISRVTDKVIEEMEAWRARPFDSVYPVVPIDALYVKIREGQVANRPTGCPCWPNGATAACRTCASPAAMGSRAGRRRSRRSGRRPPCSSAWCTWSARRCGMPLRRTGAGSPRICGRSTPLRPRPPPSSVRRVRDRGAAAIRRSSGCGGTLADLHSVPGVPGRGPQDRLHRQRDRESERRFRQATGQRGHLPTERAALKVLYLVIRQPLKGRPNVTGKTSGWKAALNALSLHTVTASP